MGGSGKGNSRLEIKAHEIFVFVGRNGVLVGLVKSFPPRNVAEHRKLPLPAVRFSRWTAFVKLLKEDRVGVRPAPIVLSKERSAEKWRRTFSGRTAFVHRRTVARVEPLDIAGSVADWVERPGGSSADADGQNIATMSRAVDNPKTTGHISYMAKTNLREEILAAGLTALHGHGFNATSVQDITEAAGVPKGSFYNHFSSKEDLGAAVVEQYALRAAGRRAILADANLEPTSRIRRYFEAMVAAAKYPGSPGCLLGNFSAELSNQSPAIRGRVSVAFDDWTRTLAVVVAQAQSAGAVKNDMAPEAIAAFLIDAWEGAVLRAKVEQSRAPLEGFLEMAFAKILV